MTPPLSALLDAVCGLSVFFMVGMQKPAIQSARLQSGVFDFLLSIINDYGSFKIPSTPIFSRTMARIVARKAFSVSQIRDLPSRASIRSKAVTRSSLSLSPSSSLILSRKPEALSRQPSFRAKPFQILF